MLCILCLNKNKFLNEFIHVKIKVKYPANLFYRFQVFIKKAMQMMYFFIKGINDTNNDLIVIYMVIVTHFLLVI